MPIRSSRHWLVVRRRRRQPTTARRRRRGWFSRLPHRPVVRASATVAIVSFVPIVIDVVVNRAGLRALCRPSGCAATSACVRPNRASTTLRVSVASKDSFTIADRRRTTMTKTFIEGVVQVVDATTVAPLVDTIRTPITPVSCRARALRRVRRPVGPFRLRAPTRPVLACPVIIGWPVGVVWPR